MPTGIYKRSIEQIEKLKLPNSGWFKKGHESVRKLSKEEKIKRKREAIKKYYNKNREEINKKAVIRMREKWRTNPVLEAEKLRIRRREVRIKAIKQYGGKCACCGEDRVEFLAIDHINNDGAEHRRKIGNVSIGVWLMREKYPEGFQVLCHNCNCAKAFYKICPHKNETTNLKK